DCRVAIRGIVRYRRAGARLFYRRACALPLTFVLPEGLRPSAYNCFARPHCKRSGASRPVFLIAVLRFVALYDTGGPAPGCFAGGLAPFRLHLFYRRACALPLSFVLPEGLR